MFFLKGRAAERHLLARLEKIHESKAPKAERPEHLEEVGIPAGMRNQDRFCSPMLHESPNWAPHSETM